jgi:hypothetical protein
MTLMKTPRRWFMQADTAINPFLCHADNGTPGEAAGGGAAGAGAGAGAGEQGTDAKPAARGPAAIAAAAEAAAPAGAETPADNTNKLTDAPKFGDFDTAVLPENLRGETPEATLALIAPALKGYRDTQAARGKVPEKADGYETLKLSEGASKVFNTEGDDPALKIAREVAHKAGLPQGEFQSVIGGILDKMVDDGLIEPPIDPLAEAKLLGDGDATKGAARAKLVDERIARMKAEDNLDDGVATELELLASTHQGVLAFEYLMGKTREKSTAAMGDTGANAGAVTVDDVKAAMRDERYDTTSPNYDKAFREKWDKLNREMSS